MDGPMINQEEDMPVGQGLGTPPCPKRKRVWQPSELAPAPSPALPTASTSFVSPHFGSEAGSEESDDELMSAFIPRAFSSVLETPTDGETDFVAFDQPYADDPVPAGDPQKPLDCFDFQVPGSEAGSDASDDGLMSAFIPRAFSSVLETPTDGETDAVAFDQPYADDPVPAGDPLKPLDCFDFQVPGSEAGSDASDDGLMSVFIPRAFSSVLETPTDGETDAVAFDQPYADDPVPAGDPQKPLDRFDFQWRAFPDPPIPPESRREKFSQSNVGPTTPRNDPYDIFVDIWDRQFMEHIASETNRYAQQVATQMFNNNKLSPRSRISQWIDTTVDELYVLFGLIIAMGVVVRSRVEEYWNATPDIFCTPGFGAHMSVNRFLLLTKCLHFNNNEDMCALKLNVSEAKLFKIQPLLSHLNMKFQRMYTPKQNIALDESLLMWKGRLDINQFIPNKAAAVGIKTYEICESQTGYLWRFEVHASKRSPQQIEGPLNAPTPDIVLRLTQGLENKGYTLWMDNYYNSPCLARHLKSKGFDCVGTLRTNRKFVPTPLHYLTKANMRPGQITGLTSGDIDIMVWRDHNRVAMISTYHGNAVTQIGDTTKPIIIADYNIMMGGVDKKDQMLALYPIERKRTRVWYKKLFRRLLNVSVLNSYIMHNQSPPITHRNFRISLVKSLLSKHVSATALLQIENLSKQRIERKLVASGQRFDVTHRSAVYPIVNNERVRRICVMCKKRVRMYCVGCKKTMCMEPCFVDFHKFL